MPEITARLSTGVDLLRRLDLKAGLGKGTRVIGRGRGGPKPKHN